MNFRNSVGIVLHGRRWSESSLILTCFTAEYGRVALVSKGARRPKSYTGAYHRPGAHVELIWIDQAARDLYSLIAIDPVESIDHPSEYNRFQIWMRTLKYVKRTTVANTPHPAGFFQLSRTLQAISDLRSDAGLLYYQFLLRWFAEVGFPMELDQCDVCGSSVRGTKLGFRIDHGAGQCEKCYHILRANPTELGVPISGEAFAWLRRLETVPERMLLRVTLSERARDEIDNVCCLYNEQHLGFSIRSLYF